MEMKRKRWVWAVELTNDFKGLQVMRDDVAKYPRRDRPKHAIAFERPARIIVRFEDEQDARRFYFTFDGQFIRL
jgi:hypothetical protein